ncbi:hypothetical protein OSTOST_21289 [Ostertagia ostertagi]
MLIFTALFVYWYFAITGVITMKSRLDARKILPLDSPLHRSYSLLENYVWNDHFTPKFYVNTEFDMTNINMTSQFWDMLKELESVPNCRGPISSLCVARRMYATNHKNNKRGNLLVHSFQFYVVYSKVTDWDIRISLLTKWRNIIDNIRLNVTLRSGAMFVDQCTALITLLSMTIVCAIFMPNPCSVATASVSIASISTGVIGLMSQFSFDLDPIVMACLLMTIGMSVDTRSQFENGKIVEVRMAVHENVSSIPYK